MSELSMHIAGFIFWRAELAERAKLDKAAERQKRNALHQIFMSENIKKIKRPEKKRFQQTNEQTNTKRTHPREILYNNTWFWFFFSFSPTRLIHKMYPPA